MIRLIFSDYGQDGKQQYHTAEVVGQKSMLLVEGNAVEIIGVEHVEDLDPVEGYITDPDEIRILRSRLAGKDLPGKIVDETFTQWATRQKSKATNAEKPVAEVGQDGGFVVPPEIAKQIEQEFHSGSCDPSLLNPERREIPSEAREQIFDAMPLVHEDRVDETPKVIAEPILELWLLMNTKTGKFVETTTTEGGLAYISCPNEQEAKKVAEQQRIYDIDSKPMRLL